MMILFLLLSLCVMVNGNELENQETYISGSIKSFIINVCVFILYTLCIAIFFAGGSNRRK